MNVKRDNLEKSFIAFVYLFLILLTVSIMYPFLNLIAISFSDAGPVLAQDVHLVPKGFNISSYKTIFSNKRMLTSMGNTIYITIVGTALNIVLTSIFAYTLSKKDVLIRGFVLKLVVFAMLFNGGIIPNYLLIKGLNLMNTFWALILPNAIIAFYLFVMKSFFEAIPAELEESAIVDGANEWKTFTKIIIPLSMPSIAAISLFYAVLKWNIFFIAILYITDTSKTVIQVMLRQIIMFDDSVGNVSDSILDMPPETKKAASIIFTVIPILLIYPFLQKYFIKGIMLGAIKG